MKFLSKNQKHKLRRLRRALCSVLICAVLFTMLLPAATAAGGVSITDVSATPYVRSDGMQETTMHIRNTAGLFTAWAKVKVGNEAAQIVNVGSVTPGTSQMTLLVPDTNTLLSPGETTTLTVELYDNADCDSSAIAKYVDEAWARTRHWEFYLSQQMHTDLGYTGYQEDLKETFSSYVDTAKTYVKNSDNRASDVQKYIYGIESGFILGEAYTAHRNADQIGEVLSMIDAGRMNVYAGQFNFTMENFGAEETARAAYYTNRRLVDTLGIEASNTINMFDNPTFSKSFVDIANSAGIKYGVHSMNPDRSPYYKAKQYDLFYLQGHDPSSKLLIFNGKTYGDNYGFGGTHYDTVGSPEKAKENLLNIIAELESRSGRRAYPYDKFLMALVPYGDNQRPMEDPIINANALNKQLADAGYAYPRVTVAFSDEFFEAVEAEYADMIPVETGTEENWWNDGWGTTAYESGVNKQTANRLPVAETLSAFASLLDGKKYPYNDISEAYNRLLTYDEHTWGNAAYDSNSWQYNNQFEWKRSNALGASALADGLVKDGLSTLASTVQTKGAAIWVYNQLNWTRDDVVTLTDLSALPEQFEIMDNGQSVPYTIEDGTLSFVAQAVPAVGYKTFDIIETKEQPTFTSGVKTDENSIENAYYKVTFAPDGTISSIIDLKNDNRELVDASAEEKFNQYRYYDDFGVPFNAQGSDFSEGFWALYTPQESVSQLKVEQTALGATARLDTATFRASGIVQKVTLYDNIPRIDIENIVIKEALPSLQSKEDAYYTFPFKSGDDYQIRYDLPVGNTAEGEQVYGTSADWYTANKWISVTDKATDYNMVLAIPDTALAQFGERRLGNWSFDYVSEKPYIYSYVMNNQWQTNFQGDQPGQVSFHYSISSNRASDLAQTTRFGWEISTPLEATLITSAQSGQAPAQDSLIKIDKENVILTTMKTAEANSDGMILRFHETAGKDTEKITVTLPVKVDSVYATDIIENDEKQIAGAGNSFTLDLDAYQMQTVRIRMSSEVSAVTGLTATTHSSAAQDNLSQHATATASSFYSDEYTPDNAKSSANGQDWASKGEKNAWYQLSWDQPITVGSIVLYDRSNNDDNIQSIKLTFDDGSSITVDNIPADGSARAVVLDAAKSTTHIKAEIIGADSALNIGLSAMEVYAAAVSTQISGTQLHWNATQDALYYEIFRSTDPNFEVGSGSYLGVSENGVYFDAQVVDGLENTYYYRVRSVAVGTKGSASAAVSPSVGALCDTSIPYAPTLYAQPRDGGRIDLHWTPVQDDVCISHYDIYRDGVKIGQTNDHYICSYRDTTAKSAKTYTYMVKAVDTTGNVSDSNTVESAALDTVSARLDGLEVSNGLLSPAFDPSVRNYTLNIGQLPLTGVRVTPYAEGATIEINGQPVNSGTPSQTIAIEAGTRITIKLIEGEVVRYYSIEATSGDPIIQPASASAGDEYGNGAHSPNNVINSTGMVGAGIDGTHDQNGDAESMWHTNANPGSAAWIEFDLGKVYALDEMYVWNMNQQGNIDRGLKNVKIEYSEDGTAWQALAPAADLTFANGNADYPFQFAQASGAENLPATNLNDGQNSPVSFGGLRARYVKITAAPTAGDGSWGSVYYGLSEIRFTTILTAEDVISVKNIEVTADENTITQPAGTLQMHATVSPKDATKPLVEWSVEDEKGRASDAAVISNDGLLTARANATVTVVATSTDGSRIKGKMTVTITGQPVVITGVTAVSGNDYNETLSAARTVDSSGMSGKQSIWDTHDNHHWAETMWHTDANPGNTAWIEFDLGAVKQIGEMHVWNLNELDKLDRGLKEIKIEYKKNKSDAWTELRGADAGTGEYPYTLAQADGSAQMAATNLVGGKPVQFAVAARYIRITAGSSYGSEYWGLSEVRFTEGNAEDIPPQAIKGDVNRSGKIDVADIITLKNLIMSGQNTSEDLIVGDMDGGGKLEVGDILAIKNLIMNQ